MCDCVFANNLRSKITSVARVEIVLLLRPVAGNVGVNTMASKRSELLGNGYSSNAPRNPQQFDLCVLAYSSCRDYAETQERKRRPVAGLSQSQTYCEQSVMVFRIIRLYSS